MTVTEHSSSQHFSSDDDAIRWWAEEAGAKFNLSEDPGQLWKANVLIK